MKYIPNKIKNLFVRINKAGTPGSAVILVANGKQIEYNNFSAIISNNNEKYFEKIRYSVLIPEKQKNVEVVAIAIPVPEEKINEDNLEKYRITTSHISYLEEGDSVVEKSK